jgi:AhpD family alkylhydroperoxidase
METENNAREKTYKEITEVFGLVPTMFKHIPEDTIELEWALFKKLQIEGTAIPNKYKELMGIAIAGATKCKYCAFYHTELAKLNGATPEEIEDAAHFGKQTAGWSSYLNGLQIDFEDFKKEIVAACDHVRKSQVAEKIKTKSTETELTI